MENSYRLSGFVRKKSDEFKGTKLYGFTKEAKDKLRQDCKIFRMSNETGYGEITVYQVLWTGAFFILKAFPHQKKE